MRSWGRTMTTNRVKRWQVCVAVALLLLCAVFLLLTSRKQSPRRVSFDLTNWRLTVSEGVTFSPDGARLKTGKAYHYGPITIVSERHWELEPGPLLGTNAFPAGLGGVVDER